MFTVKVTFCNWLSFGWHVSFRGQSPPRRLWTCLLLMHATALFSECRTGVFHFVGVGGCRLSSAVQPFSVVFSALFLSVRRLFDSRHVYAAGDLFFL